MKEWQSIGVPSLLKGILILTIDFFGKSNKLALNVSIIFPFFL